MSFTQSVSAFFRNYFDFRGVAQRSEFWWAILFMVGVTLVAQGIDSVLTSAGLPHGVNAVLSIVLFVPWYSVTARRLHDVGRSGWWMLAPMLFILLTVVLLASLMPTGSLTPGPSPEAHAMGGRELAIVAVGALATFGMQVTLIVWLATRGTGESNRHCDGYQVRYG